MDTFSDDQTSPSDETTLATCLEWSILQGIGANATLNLAENSRSWFALSDPQVASGATDNSMRFLEADLRYLLFERKLLTHRIISKAQVEKVQDALARLCCELDNFVNPSYITNSRQKDQSPRSYCQPDYRQDTSYQNLRVLSRHCQSSEVPNVFSVNSGSSPGSRHEALFLVSSANAADILNAIEECDSCLAEIQDSLDDRSQSRSRFSATTQPSTPSSSAFGCHATKVLESLFRHFCKRSTVHNVRLSLSYTIESSFPASNPVLEMLLPGCQCPETMNQLAWHLTQCLPYREDLDSTYQAVEIKDSDLCHELQLRQTTRDAMLTLFLKSRGLYNAKPRFGGFSAPHLDPITLMPLDELIKNGAFRRSTRARFGLKEKGALATKLAHCLRDFLLAGSTKPKWDGKLGIFMAPPPDSDRHNRESLFMTFSEHNSKNAQQDTLEALLDSSEQERLTFARLVLEIYLGRPIESHLVEVYRSKLFQHGRDEALRKSQPLKQIERFSDLHNVESFSDLPLIQQFTELCVCLHDIQSDNPIGPHFDAVYDAVHFHRVCKPRPRETPVDTFQRAMLEKIVSPFEKEIVSHKRRRSESEQPQDEWVASRRSTMLSTDTDAVASISSHRHIKLAKRRRIEVVQTTALVAKAATPGRVTIFRAQHVIKPEGKTTVDAVKEIISSGTTCGNDGEYRMDVRDVTPSNLGRSKLGKAKRGSAIIYFQGTVPDGLRNLSTKSDNSKAITSDSTDGGLSMEVDANFFGITQLYEPPPTSTVSADILFIHGLNGHPCGSWLSKSAEPKLWPHEFLPGDLPDCRIMLYGYNSDIFRDQQHDRHELVHQARRLNATLSNVRLTRETKNRPIIFIAHSYGGLILARTLINASDGREPLHAATRAIFLMACPMRGFHVDDVLSVVRAEQLEIEGDITQDKVQQLLHRLGSGDFFQNELSAFSKAVKGKRIFSFYEMDQTQTLTNHSGLPRRDGDSVKVARHNSVILGIPEEEAIPADKDHSNIVKYATRGDQTYQDIKCRVEQVLMEIPS